MRSFTIVTKSKFEYGSDFFLFFKLFKLIGKYMTAPLITMGLKLLSLIHNRLTQLDLFLSITKNKVNH